jgi:hypothetical protein
MLPSVWHWKHFLWKICAISRLKTIFVVIGTCEYTGSGLSSCDPAAAAPTISAAPMGRNHVTLTL